MQLITYKDFKSAILYVKYRLKWHLARFYNFGYPIHIDLELNNNCNQKCIACHHGAKRKAFKTAQVQASEAIRIIGRARRAGAMSIKFNVRGEPLLYKKLIRVISAAKQAGYIDIMLNTNGQLLDYDTALSLQYAGLTSLTISVDSFDPSNYATIHGCRPEDWFVLMTSLKDLKRIREAGNLKMNVRFNYHLNTINKDENISKYKEMFGFPIVIKHTRARAGADIALMGGTKRPLSCSHASRRLVYLSNGKVYPCPMVWDEQRDIQLGESDSNPIELWNSGKREMIIEAIGHGRPFATCKRCIDGGGCG